MSTQQVVIQGQVQPDGTLVTNERVNLPPGPVSVTIEAEIPPAPRESTSKVLQEILAQHQASGREGRSKEEIDAEIDAMRNEDEERMRELERLFEQNRPKKG